ncbi:hypothetical protein AURDEDRAFT_178151 [Auricularia subglabra TFB-10046 SS5]|uniref:Uncharacterized protein n=1 Tax=Auricularia subglabra (strain TFB-10046 / SS5) TaxID=717982 RepID=J0D2A9_AURST|nr:hypothetical protein AURDEDRAFT_178151 [Auricularia subglabra TFB-10046 SS5]
MVSHGEYVAVCDILDWHKRLLSNARKENKRLNDTLRRERRDRANAISKAVAAARVISVKEKGVVPHPVRALIRDWSIVCNVPSKKLFPAIRIFCHTFGLTLRGTFSHGLVGLCITEGGLGSRLQVAVAVKDAVGITLSSDGTTHRGQNFNAHHITCKSADGAVRTYNAGVKRVPSKTAEVAFGTWQSLTEDMWELLKTAIPGSAEQMTAAIFLSAVCGTTGDHAADQRKLNRLIMLWKQSVDRLQRGRDAIGELPTLEYALLVSEVQITRMEAIGGSAAWEALSEEARQAHIREGLDEVAIRMGWERFNDLDPQTQASVDFFYHFGCEMHKELNTVVAGNKALQEFWAKTGYTAPMKLVNQDNSVAAASGSAALKQRAERVSQSGGAKVASMLGSLFRHKNPNKGYQRQFNSWMSIEVYGSQPDERYRTIEFPDVGRARFQMTCAAAGFTLLHLGLIRRFLELMRDVKDTPGFNHFEANVYAALHDAPTLTEFACLALYALAVTVPYVAQVRRPGINALDLAPMHEKIRFHCGMLARRPQLLTEGDPNSSHVDAAFDGEPYRDVAVVHAIHRLHQDQQLPHLNEAFSAFLRGAEAGWDHFTPEFKDGSVLATASAKDLARSHAQPTNDRAEGALGGKKRYAQHKAHATDSTVESALSYNENGTGEFMARQSKETLDNLRPLARQVEKANRRNPAALGEVAHLEEKAAENVENARVRTQRANEARAALEQRLAEHEPRRIMTSDQITAKLTVKILDAEVEWHRHRGLPADHPAKISTIKKRLKTKPQKIAALKRALDALNGVQGPEENQEDGEVEPQEEQLDEMDVDDFFEEDS